ncbi:hypothetical protein GWI33_005152 [Rhynchophorus ferrugineus]|uniref:Uncharacterized protein n=1 Tax=Rhynchophorus ferrugineus TaxID=354439 RepID=A0A834IHV6_RHYFE|nr:hypothetical protein GWI33_005152 [Rhynchophorus ferrugineus]
MTVTAEERKAENLPNLRKRDSGIESSAHSLVEDHSQEEDDIEANKGKKSKIRILQLNSYWRVAAYDAATVEGVDYIGPRVQPKGL